MPTLTIVVQTVAAKLAHDSTRLDSLQRAVNWLVTQHGADSIRSVVAARVADPWWHWWANAGIAVVCGLFGTAIWGLWLKNLNDRRVIRSALAAEIARASYAVRDHIIIGRGRYTSFAEEGWL